MEVKQYLPKLNTELQDIQRRLTQQSPVNIVSEARKSLTEDKGKLLTKKNCNIHKIPVRPIEDPIYNQSLNNGAIKNNTDVRAQSAIEGNHRDKRKENPSSGILQSDTKSSRKNSEQLKGEIELKIKNMKTEFNQIKIETKQTSFGKLDKFRNRSLKKNEYKPQQAFSAPVDPILHEDIVTQRPLSQKSVFRIRHSRNDSSDKFRNSENIETPTINHSGSAKTIIQRKVINHGVEEEEINKVGITTQAPPPQNGPVIKDSNQVEADHAHESSQNNLNNFKRKANNGLQEKLEQVKRNNQLANNQNLGYSNIPHGVHSHSTSKLQEKATNDAQTKEPKEKGSFFENKPTMSNGKKENISLKVVLRNNDIKPKAGSDIAELISPEQKRIIVEKKNICKEEWITYNNKNSQESSNSPYGRRLPQEENENNQSGGGVDNEDSQETNSSDQIPEIKINDTKLGEGAYAQVYLGFIPSSGKFVAVKHIRLLQDSDEKFSEQIKSLTNEINLLKRLKSDSIVKYYGCKMNQDNYYIYMEYMPGGSISTMLKRYGAFEEPMIKRFVKQLLVGLHYLHSQGVVHSDLKGGNILSDGEGKVKLADFGASKYLENLPRMSTSSSDFNKSIKGSLFWMAPELLNQESHGRKIDIWSLGCTVIEMASGKHPWPDCKSFTELVVEVMTKKCPPIPDGLTEVCKDFIRKCCNFNKKERPRANDLMDHPFLKD